MTRCSVAIAGMPENDRGAAAPVGSGRVQAARLRVTTNSYTHWMKTQTAMTQSIGAGADELVRRNERARIRHPGPHVST